MWNKTLSQSPQLESRFWNATVLFIPILNFWAVPLPPQPASVSSRRFLNNPKVQNNRSHCGGEKKNWCAVSFNGSQSLGNSGQIQNRVLTSLHSGGSTGVSGAALIYG